MTSISLRGDSVPSGIILLKDDTVTPAGYSSISTYNTKYMKQVPTAGTNPGNNVGATSHTHTSESSHSHTAGSGVHGHTGGLGLGSPQHNDGVSNVVGAEKLHLHTYTAGNITPTLTIPSQGSHTHNTINNDPLFRTYRLIKKNTVINLRARHIPFNALVLWPKTNVTIPPGLVTDTNIFTRVVKIDATAGTNGGNANHQHDSIGHTHLVALASHNTHSIPTSSVPTILTTASGSQVVSSSTHVHAPNSPTQGAGAPSVSSDNKAHTHDSLSIIPASKETALIKLTNIQLRREGIPINVVVLWEDLLADIPSTFALADGTSGTDNYLDKYSVGPPDGGTDPGSDVGSQTHTHDSQAHSHANVALLHTHTLTGACSASASTVMVGVSTGGATLKLMQQSHTHNHNTLSNTGPTTTLPSTGAHTHGTKDHKPDSKEMAFVQRI